MERRTVGATSARIDVDRQGCSELVGIADAIDHFVFTADAQGRVDYVNTAFAVHVGVPREELYGAHWLEAVHPEDRSRLRVRLEECLATHKALREECRIVAHDERDSWFDIRLAPTSGCEEARWVGSAVEIEEWRSTIENLDRERHELARSLQKLGEGLREAQKMEALGRLAGGVAHDFNNLLTIIMACNEEVLDRCAEDDENRVPLIECRLAAKRASSLTRDLLSFSRRQQYETKVLDLNQIVIEGERLLGRLLGEDVRLVTSLASDLGTTNVDPGQWTSVLVNLAVNARHAMPHGGELSVITRNVIVHAHETLPPGRYALLQVSDTGHGFDSDTAERLFDPFFTTKAPGSGTGLGLTVVQNVVRESRGYIWATSEPGRGTTFTIHVPIVEAKPPVRDRTLPPPALAGNEMVLLVEDDAQVRQTIQRALESYGYTVLSAPAAEVALRLLRRNGKQVDILVTDVVLPRMNGRSLVDLVKQRHPGIRVLYTSGYMDDAIAQRGVEKSEVAFLGKPYTARKLIQQMRLLLDAPPSRNELRQIGEVPIRVGR